MSFGSSPSDIIILVKFCKEMYRKCRDAAGEYDEISREVRGLHTVLKHLKYEVEAPESPLNKDHSIWGRQLVPIISDCDLTLRQLDELLQKYGRLGNDDGPSPSSPSSARVLWDRVKFGSNEMDQLGAIRVKLISHKTSLTLFLDTIQLHQSGKMAVKLDCHQGQLDTILDKVDKIATRLEKKRDGSIMTSYDDDDKEVWKQFRRELVAEGFSSDVLQQHKDVLRAYIREIDQKGQLDEPRTPPAVDAEHWVNLVHSSTFKDIPPSFSSLGAGTDDGSVKEMMVREENLKFPQSIKLERSQLETRRQGTDLNAVLPSESSSRAVKVAAPKVPLNISVAPKIVTSGEKEVFWHNTDGSSDDESEDETSSIIRTTDLRALTQAIQLRVPGSPSSFRSSVGSIGSDASHSMGLRPNQPQHMSSSPARLGAIPIPSNANPRSSASSFGTSSTFKLAPDGHGNEIPADAKWTKIDRKQVSPEVLTQYRLRYEARPEFVAILGVLSRKEIEDLAARSQALRNARRKSSSQNSQEKAPLPPPRPIPVQQPSSDDRRRIQGSSSSSSSFSDSETSDSDDSHHRRHHHNKHKSHSDASSTIGIPIHGYPNPYGVPPSPPPVWAPEPSSTARQAIFTSDRPNQQPPPVQHSFAYNAQNSHTRPHFGGTYWPNSRPPQQHYVVRDEKREERRERPRNDRQLSDRTHNERDRDRHPDKDRIRDGSRRGRHSTSAKSKKSTAPPQQQGRWKRDLKVAGIGGGIGGAAVSLLNVLVEAAEGL